MKITKDNVFCPECESNYVSEENIVAEKCYQCQNCGTVFTEEEALKHEVENE